MALCHLDVVKKVSFFPHILVIAYSPSKTLFVFEKITIAASIQRGEKRQYKKEKKRIERMHNARNME